jgi:hypothetical protein
VVSTTITNPHLWNGLFDPYLYQTFVELRVGTNVTDVVSQPLGFRYFSVDPTNGFFLNGQHYDLHGVNMHQDWLDRGWAIGDPERRTNFMLIKEIGATFVRLSHYEHADNTYQLADQNGILLWSEIPLINGITVSPAFDTNTEQQLIEMIRQRYNHPAVVCWSLFNEEGVSASNLVSQLAPLAAQEDPTRPTTAASNQSDSAPLNWYSSQVAFNKYYGWYSTPTNGVASWADNIHATYPSRSIGVSEYGAGASIYQHSENPAQPSNTATNFHAEEWQNIVHEQNWQLMKVRPFLWCKTVWNMFDFASDGRNEGDHPGRNDKGLVTYDRQVRKDAFFWYKANWTTNPMVYITGRTFTNRQTNFITAKVYANCDSVELFLNGVSQGSSASTNFIFTWPVTLVRGSNSVMAVGSKGSTNVSDSLLWLLPPAAPSAVILSPAAAIVYLNSTNDTLQLLATASDSQSNPPPLITDWYQLNGPGAVTFGNSNALATTARFSAEGVYSLSFSANNGTVTNVGLTVVVNPATSVANGLLAWWKMDESGGSTAADSSGNGRNAAIVGAVFTNGYLGNALRFNGTTNFATFSSPDATQLTVAAWVKADSKGNSAYPRILDTNPGYRFFFRFDGSGSNGLDFATYSSANGDWFSGQNTISLGAWYHVAASYDRSSFANVPALYVNGIKRSLTTISSPSGTQTNYIGTGYIGNQAATNRGWGGPIDDLRLYNRLLSDSEVLVLASMPPTNLAPVVNAGVTQTVLWPAPASLSGSASDDGKPNPPGVLTTTWSEVSGPGAATFANSNTPATSVSFSAAGTYVLRLMADDGQVKTSSDITVIAATRPVIALQRLPGALQLSWPPSNGTWRLQTQTNPLPIGLSSNWSFVPDPITNPYVVPIDPTVGSVFHRLIFTNQ